MCTARVDEDVFATLIDVKAHRKNPMLFLTVPRNLDERDRKEFLAPLTRLAAAGVPYYLVESTEETTRVVSA